jgi:hypothetical protein
MREDNMTGTIRLACTTAFIAASTAILSGCSQLSEGQPTAQAPSSPATVTETVTAKASATAAPAAPKPAKNPAGGGTKPCTAKNLEGVVAPGDGPTPDTYHTAIVIRNISTSRCTLQGTSKVSMYTGGNGSDIGIRPVASSADAAEVVTLEPGDLAAMSVQYSTAYTDPVPTDCAENGAFAKVEISGEADAVTAWYEDRSQGFPPVCSAVNLGAWSKGGAPGVHGQ